jgi:hypothetical protein
MGGQLLKPTNLGKKGCSPVSSECVIWQGDDIDCLQICNGDTISDVMFRLACMVCTIKDQLDVDTYDLECLNIAACDTPHTFREFMQFVIGKLCEFDLNGTPQEQQAQAEQIMTVASCFQSGGLTQTISDYVAMIGQLVCEQQITIQDQQVAIENLISRVEALEGGA